MAASISTDGVVYSANLEVSIDGSTFVSDDVTLQVTYPDGSPLAGPAGDPWVVSASLQGDFLTTWTTPLLDTATTLLLTAEGNQTTESATASFDFAPPAANLDQLRNGAGGSPVDPGVWVNGNLNSSTSHYVEEWSAAYRAVMTDMPIGNTVTLTLEYDIKHSDKHALDYLTHYDRIDDPLGSHVATFGHTKESIDPTDGVSGVVDGSPPTAETAIPVPPVFILVDALPQPQTSFNALPVIEKNMSLWGGTFVGATPIVYPTPLAGESDLSASNSATKIDITFLVSSSTMILSWGGHIGSRNDWGSTLGVPNSAGGISGSPYHMRLIDWTLNNLGNQDRSLSAGAVESPDPPECALSVDILDVCDGANACVTVTATQGSSPYNYSWVGPNSYTATTAEICFTNIQASDAGTYTVTVTDDNGLTCESELTVIVNSDPPTITCPANVSISCDASTDPANTGSATATDVCDPSPTITYSDATTAGVCANSYTITRTWTATDVGGNFVTCDQIITVTDGTAPVITCPADVPVSCDGSTDPANTGSATATDNCDASPTISSSDVTTAGVCANSYTITRTWTATDACGNTVSCDQIITVTDGTAPVITCPANVSVSCDASTDPASTGSATATDDCDTSPTISSSDVTTAGSCANSYTITRTWTATDACGNSSSCDQIITVADTQAPTLVGCPSDVTVSCDAIPSAATVTASDNCDVSVTVTFSESEVAGSCAQNKTITRTWTATDACGNSASCDQVITVVDNTAPVVTCPADLTIQCSDSDDPANTGSATATDDCDPSPVIGYTDVITSGATPEKYTITRTWTATDDCGNSSSCDQIITVTDGVPPVITCPADAAVSCDESTDPANTGSATATDNCDASPTISSSDVTTAGSCANSYTITRTWTATDACGNSVSCDQIITVTDGTAPVITCPSNTAVECDGSTDPANTGSATATDNCDTSPAISFTDATTAGACANSFTITRTWTATDACGNSSSCDQIITVADTQAPTLVGCPSDVTVSCDAIPSAATVTASDNCDASATVTFSESEVAGSCAQNKTITRTWTSVDECGNSASCDQVITVVDNTAPVVTCPADLTIQCSDSDDPANTGSATATDDCDPSPVVSYTDVITAGASPEKYTITRTWTATDDCGNSSSCDQIITVTDGVPPVITCPADAAVSCDESTDPANTGSATATDNCDASPIISSSDVTTAGSCDNSYTLTRTWMATDACGNTVSCDQIITVTDGTAPVITCPADVSAACDGPTDPATTGSATATDNCDSSPVISSSDVITAGSCANSYTITRTWLATDECGNSASCDQVITVTDSEAPVCSLPASTQMTLCAPAQVTLPVSATDNCDSDVTCVVTSGPGSIVNGQWTYTPTTSGVASVTIRCTDDCGNFCEGSFSVIFSINEAPVPSCQDFVTVAVCDLDATICIPGFECVDGDGNFDTQVVTGGSFSNGSVCFVPGVEGDHVITITCTDDCGAQQSCVTTVTVVLDDCGDDCPTITIEKAHDVIQGQTVCLSIWHEGSVKEYGGYDLLIAYDNSALTALNAVPGDLVLGCGWEYFTYRFGPTGNCTNACPSGLIRLIALSETNDGALHPLCFGPASTAPVELAQICFHVSNDRTLECQYAPVRFYWTDCGDNTLSDKIGDSLFVSGDVFDFDNVNSISDPNAGFPTYLGTQAECLVGGGFGKPVAIPCVTFQNGGVDIVCADSIDARGDVNLNGVANEIADAVMFTEYFVQGLAAFGTHVDGSTAATEINGDGVPLSVGDLVYLTRIIIGDAQPLPKLAHGAITATITRDQDVFFTDVELGGALFVFAGSVEVELLQTQMTLSIGQRDNKTFALIVPDLTNSGAGSMGLEVGAVIASSGVLLSVEAADYDGATANISTKVVQPTSFALHQNYPNPFNPATKIEFDLPYASTYTLDVYNVNGQKVAEFSGTGSGRMEVTWEAGSVASGVYFYKLTAGNFTATRKMALLK